MNNAAKPAVKVLGIDPGTGRMGFGIAEQKSGKFYCHAIGCISTPPKTVQATRLATLQTELQKIITTHKPTGAVVEKLFFSKNIRTGIAVAEARGMIITTITQNNLPLLELSPQQVKMGVTGYGKATKGQVQIMVQKLFCLANLPEPDDAADALALAFVGLSHFKH